MVGGLPEDSMAIVEGALGMGISESTAFERAGSESFASSESFGKLSNAIRVRLVKIGQRIKL